MSLFPKFEISHTPAKPAKPLIKKASTLATLAGVGATEKKNGVRYAYRFRLHNDEGGGVVLTDEPDLGRARDNLAEIYGNRLVVVVRA